MQNDSQLSFNQIRSNVSDSNIDGNAQVRTLKSSNLRSPNPTERHHKRRKVQETLYQNSREPNLYTTSPAQEAVFDTAELVENIILQLPPLRIILSKLVCTQWKVTTEKSKAIRDKVDSHFFFRSENMPPQKWIKASQVWGQISAVKTPCPTPYMTLSDRTTGRKLKARLNPFLKICKGLTIHGPVSDVRVYFTFREPYKFITQSLRDRVSDGWRNMFVADPPWSEAVVIMQWASSGPGPVYVKFGVVQHVANRNGITFGDLMDAMIYQKGTVSGSYWGSGVNSTRFESTGTTLQKAVEKFEARWGRQTFKIPEFNALL